MFNSKKIKNRIEEVGRDIIGLHRNLESFKETQAWQERFNKELEYRVKELEREISSLHYKVHSDLDITKGERISPEDRQKQEARWEMLKDYLGVEEEEYAELEDKTTYVFPSSTFGYDIGSDRSAVKKTKLVKKKKK